MKKLESLRDELAEKYREENIEKGELNCRHMDEPEMSFAAGFDAASEEWQKIVEPLVEAMTRLTMVGPPSRSTAGLEYAQVALQDNCNIAREALKTYEESLK